MLITIGLAVVAGLLGGLRYRHLPASLRWLALLAGFDALMEVICYVLASLLHVHNLFLAPFIMIGELVLLSLAYNQLLQSAAFSRALPWVLSVVGGYALLHSPLHLNVVRYTISLNMVSDLMQLGLAGLYFQKLLNELRVKNLGTDPFFWVSVALALHGLGDLLISLSSNYVLTHYSLQLQKIIFWGVRNVFNLLLYAGYCLAFQLRPQPAPLLPRVGVPRLT